MRTSIFYITLCLSFILLQSGKLSFKTFLYSPEKSLHELQKKGYNSPDNLASSIWLCLRNNCSDSCNKSFTPPELWQYMLYPFITKDSFALSWFNEIESGSTKSIDKFSLRALSNFRKKILTRYPNAFYGDIDSVKVDSSYKELQDKSEVIPFKLTIFLHDSEFETFKIILHESGLIGNRWYVTEYNFVLI